MKDHKEKHAEKTESPQRAGRPALGERSNSETGDPLALRHLALGWWSLLVFLVLGIALEVLHGFKAGLYLNVSAAPRRLMWTLAHAHGTLLALVHIAFAVSLAHLPRWPTSSRRTASACLTAAGLLLPLGFFLGGLFIHGGDPGLGILLVPVAATLLLIAVFSVAVRCRRD
ncbi:MAG: hypothetical protein HY299_02350 [Verrucomicrobia bacterium]|nr:hypothetical protein [Verrucomicrobiota bacterium]